MNIAHVNVKLFTTPASRLPWHALIPVFHRWIQSNALPGLLIDVADYSHVPDGPGVMLIGHEAFWSVDHRRGRPGLLYNRRTATHGSAEEQIQAAYEAALTAARKLEAEPECSGLAFDERDFEVFVNDRLLAPNTKETWERLQAPLRSVFPAGEFDWDSDPRGLFRVRVRLNQK